MIANKRWQSAPRTLHGLYEEACKAWGGGRSLDLHGPSRASLRFHPDSHRSVTTVSPDLQRRLMTHTIYLKSNSFSDKCYVMSITLLLNIYYQI